MKTNFKFTSLLGTVYRSGNLLFTPDGNSLLSPVGNRVTVFDLINDKSYTLPFAHRKNISCISLTPDGTLLLSVDEDGKAILSHVPRRLVLYHFSFKSSATALAFAPNGAFFVVALGRAIQVWRTPLTPETSEEGDMEFAPFVRYRTMARHFDAVHHLGWSSDSRFFLSTSDDLTARIWSLDIEEGFHPTSLSGHREALRGAFFSKDQESIYTVSQDGALFHWAYVPEKVAQPEVLQIEGDELPARWRIVKRHYFLQNNAKVTSVCFYSKSGLLVSGFTNGVFVLHEMPDFNQVHSLSISQNNIDTVTINSSGEWFALASRDLGQLLVWEWQSENYILKQQGQFDALQALTYSPDGQKIITASDDGKIKLWDARSGFCVVTFSDHTAGVTACEFSKRGNVLFTASLDGSVKAWDLVRYRNFRTFTAPSKLSFSCMVVDPSGEIICAGSVDSFDVHIWSVQTGQLLDQMSGHEGPISSLAFAPDGGVLVSGSWDRTVRIWNIFGRTQSSEPLALQADVLAVAIRPDSRQVAISTLDSQLTFWEPEALTQGGGIDVRRDASGGRKIGDRRTAANVADTKWFSAITYSADGSCILAGGNSKFICLYNVSSGVLIKKFTISVNLSIDGTQEFLNSRDLTEAGPVRLLEDAQSTNARHTLPGASKSDLGKRRLRPEIRVNGLAFAPSGASFCVASTEGLLIYSLDAGFEFDPFDLSTDVTPASTLEVMKELQFARALMMAFRLNEPYLLRKVYEAVPTNDIQLVVTSIPSTYLGKLARYVALSADETPHLEYNLVWIANILKHHGSFLRDHVITYASELKLLQRSLDKIQRDLGKLTDENNYAIEYLLAGSGAPKSIAVARVA